ncbi:MAG: oxidoreductase [Betaproteobacteria bacterium RIFCSPLOWO2_02_FULL_63_19]|nr:MAG: oxidoreductase [Betaproteobacteria bacterium RIFCSPLOWO2_02_FULL_63_19]
MLNTAIVGLGRWGERLVDAVHAPPSAKLRFTHAVVRTPERVRVYCSERGIRVAGDLAQVLAEPEVGAVALATPHSQHAEQVAAAAAAGKHVFVEKPFTLDAASARQAARACRDANVVLALGHNRRFLPALVEMKRMAAAGDLGEILHLEGDFSGNSGLRYTPGMWRASEAESPLGGMAGMGIHIIDAFIHLVGPIASVRCESQRRVIRVDLDDTTSVFMRFANGATGCLNTLMATPRMFRLQVFGTRGWLHLLDHRNMDICDADGNVRHVGYPPFDIERAELEAFADAVAGVATYAVPVNDAIHGIAVMDAAMRSAAGDGERVTVDARGI